MLGDERGYRMKKPYSVGYFSSYDRGLECLLKMWSKIKEKVPEATLDIYYGWNTFDKMHAGNPEMMKWKFQMIQLMNQDGVTEHGRVNHEELAKAMKEIQVWAYPTVFTEISCITAMKAQIAGMQPVVNAIAALDETVQFGKKLYLDNIYEDEQQQSEFINAIVEALKNSYDPKKAQKWAEDTYSWTVIAKVWSEACV